MVRRQIRSLGREATAWARQGQLMFLSRRQRGLPPGGPRTVVFIHGWGAGGKVFGPLRKTVEDTLRVPTLEFTYRSSSPFPRIVDDLAQRVEQLAARGTRLDLVGHSLGGLIARWYLQEQGGAARVQRLVTIATPHAGTRSARLAVGPLRTVLLPGSHVVERLASGRERASSVQHTALVAGSDLMVSPPASAAAVADAEVIWFDQLGHNAMLFDRAVHGAVLTALEAPSPARPLRSAPG